MNPSPASVVLQYIDYINAGDLDGLVSLTAEEYRFTDIAGRVAIVRGEEAVRRFWNGYFKPYPDYRIHIQHVLRSGDGVAVVGRTTGSHVPAEIEARSTVLWTAALRRDMVSEWRIYSSEGYAQHS